MKYIDITELDSIGGERIDENDTFFFECRKEMACFNRCCHNLNLILYPYDIIRIKNRLGISSDQFLDAYTDSVLRNGNYFPDLFLRMNEDEEKSCPFLTDAGCSIYSDRPGTCRMFPIEQGMVFNAQKKMTTDIFFFRPPIHCLGPKEQKVWTIPSWIKAQNALPYARMAVLWAEFKRLFSVDPWQGESLNHSKGKMAFMAIYNIDKFREFVFNSSFLKRYHVPYKVLNEIRNNDTELLKLSFEWVKTYLWAIPTNIITLRK